MSSVLIIHGNYKGGLLLVIQTSKLGFRGQGFEFSASKETSFRRALHFGLDIVALERAGSLCGVLRVHVKNWRTS